MCNAIFVTATTSLLGIERIPAATSTARAATVTGHFVSFAATITTAFAPLALAFSLRMRVHAIDLQVRLLSAECLTLLKN